VRAAATPETGEQRQVKECFMTKKADVGGITAGQLQAFIERIERLEEEKAGIGQDIKDIFAEAKANGFDPKIMKMVLRIRKMDREERAEQEEMLDLYCQALGMSAGSIQEINRIAEDGQAA
jgi:uncharacterized protein (UPF0335 family)